jgi:hypothetical protein
MKKLMIAALMALAGAANAGTAWLDGVLQVGADGSEGNAYDFGTLDNMPATLLVATTGAPSGSFEEYANFSIGQPSDVWGAANSFALSFFASDATSITNLMIEVWDDKHPNGSTLLATFAGNNIATMLGTLDAGQYHLDISGDFGSNSRAVGYGVALAAVPAVPEPQTYALMLAGLGAVAFMARRRRASGQQF